MDENKKKTLQNIEIAVLSILIIAMIVLIIYMVFIKKDDNKIINNNLDTIELKEVYEFKDEVQDRTDTFFVDTNGDVYLFSTYEYVSGYDESSIEEYNIKNVSAYKNNKTFRGIRIALNNIEKVYNIEYGTAGGHYFAFLTSDNRLYFTNDYSLYFFTNDELVDIVDVIDEEKCYKIDNNGNECSNYEDNCGVECAMWAYAINNKGVKIDLHNIERVLTEG